ncbi:MAG: twin-arginine translocation signal domain-containing protein [Cocleimonas sp.]
MKKYAEAKISRRQFLSSGAALGATAVAAVAIPNVALAAEEVPVVENNKEEGYQLTQHVADYYKSAAL